MKKIEAVIIPSQLDAVRLAGERGGICGKLTLTEVRQGDADAPSVRTEGGSSGPLQHRIKIELIVSDRRADNIILRTHPRIPLKDHDRVILLTVCQVLQFAQPRQN